MFKVKRQIAKNNKNHYGTGNTKKFIVVHETDNWSYGANAQAHANLLSNGYKDTWHYSVDDMQAIQSFEHDVRCWHAGDGRKKDGGNYAGIGIEICVNRDGNYNKAVQNAVHLVRKIMKDENIPLDNVKPHKYFSGKNCPSGLLTNRNGLSWLDFIDMVKEPKLSLDTSTINDLVERTIAGEFGNGETRKRNLGEHYQEVQTRINQRFKKVTHVNVDDLVARTLAGEFGNGETRKRLLGENYNAVQREINKRYTKPSVNINDLVNRTIAGEFGNGETRKRLLGEHYQEVQNLVNKRYR